jgi:hypothetical protein
MDAPLAAGSRTCSFLDLPRELRDMIYDYAFRDLVYDAKDYSKQKLRSINYPQSQAHKEIYTRDRWHQVPNTLIRDLTVNKLILDESLLVVLRNTHFKLTGPLELGRYIKPTFLLREHITTVTIHLSEHNYIGYWYIVRKLQKCPKLTHLTITTSSTVFDAWHKALITSPPQAGPEDYMLKSYPNPTSTLTCAGLEMFAELRGLEEFHLEMEDSRLQEVFTGWRKKIEECIREYAIDPRRAKGRDSSAGRLTLLEKEK